MSGARTIYVIGGTTEGNRAVRRLEQEGYRVVLSVATSLGAELAACREVEVGRKDAADFVRRAGDSGAAAIVDCSHPFAEDVSRQAASAAESLGIPLYRFSRAESPRQASHLSRADSWPEAVAFLQARRGRALMTIGVRRLELFTSAGIELAARILPQVESLRRCLELGLAPGDIIAAQPPHSLDFNRACIRHVQADLVVAKDSGDEGGVDDKIAAAAAEGIEALLVSRPREAAALHDLDLLTVSLREELADA